MSLRLSSCCNTMADLPNSTIGFVGRKLETTWLGVRGCVSGLTELFHDSQTAWSSSSWVSGGSMYESPATTARPRPWTVRVSRSARVACSPGRAYLAAIPTAPRLAWRALLMASGSAMSVSTLCLLALYVSLICFMSAAKTIGGRLLRLPNMLKCLECSSTRMFLIVWPPRTSVVSGCGS